MAFNRETGKYEGFIYVITNNVNGKQYVGQTKTTIEHRFGQHISNSKKKRNDVIYKAIRKYGKENFNVNEICKLEFTDKNKLQNELNEKEIFYIAKYNTLIPYGYNILVGGNINPSYLCAKPVDQYDLDGNFIRSYDSLSEASLTMGCKHLSGTIQDVCNKKEGCYSAYGYLWCYKGEKLIIPNGLKRKYVYQFTLDGVFVKKHNSKEVAGKEVGASSSSIYYACTTNNHECHGFLWSYENVPPLYNKYERGNTIGVKKYDEYGNLIAKYISIKEGTDKSKNSKSESIINCCKGKTEYTKDGIWRYESDEFSKFPLHLYCIYDNNLKEIKRFFTKKELLKYFNTYQAKIDLYINADILYENTYYIKHFDVNASKSA